MLWTTADKIEREREREIILGFSSCVMTAAWVFGGPLFVCVPVATAAVECLCQRVSIQQYINQQCPLPGGRGCGEFIPSITFFLSGTNPRIFVEISGSFPCCFLSAAFSLGRSPPFFFHCPPQPPPSPYGRNWLETEIISPRKKAT